jgi:hypothetical protein
MSIQKAKARRFQEEELRTKLSGALERLHFDLLSPMI